ncbi:MAG TPA: hypothetical protein VJT32_05895 [bacterium]|nr:hypothetical protein [bacterium]
MKLSLQKTYDRADGKRRTYGERYANKQALNGTTSRIRVDSESLLDPVLRQDRKQHSDGDRNR